MIRVQWSMNLAGHTIAIAGIASARFHVLMGASGYLVAKSEREVFEHEIAMGSGRRSRLMPELEQEEPAARPIRQRASPWGSL